MSDRPAAADKNASKKAAYSKIGNLFKYEESSSGASQPTWGRYYTMLRNHELLFFAGEAKDEEAKEVVDLEDAIVTSPDAGKIARRFAMDITIKNGMTYHLCADNRDEHESWLQALAVAAVPDAWPGGVDLAKRPQPLLYSMWVIQHTNNAASVGPTGSRGGAGGGSGSAAAAAAAAKDAKVPSPFSKLPALKSAPSWQRRGLLLQKLRQCSVVFDGVDPSRYPEDREIKRNTLLELVDYADASGRSAFTDPRLLEDTFTMLKLNLFRSLPRAPEPSGDPDEEEEAFSDPQWAHLSIVYELLLRLVSMDHVDLALKKKVIDPTVVRQLMLLFDSEDPRERDYLKTITHRIYSKLTQRRALIRRVICNVFYEFVFETEAHNGIAEMLEILASIINGFAVPIKDEHRIMLVRAMLPLHRAKNIAAYHPQLSYCMALYASKDHSLTRDIIPGLLKCWPFGNSTKQIMFLNELEDLFEYVLEDDVEAFRERLAIRLSKCIGGLHFQVAERTLLLWNSERFTSLMLENPQHRPHVFRILFPTLYENQQNHWHEAIRTLSGHVLDQYGEVDHELFFKLKNEYDAKMEAQLAAELSASAAAPALAAAAAAAAAAATVPGTPGPGSSSPSSAAANGAAATASSSFVAAAASSGSGFPPVSIGAAASHTTGDGSGLASSIRSPSAAAAAAALLSPAAARSSSPLAAHTAPSPGLHAHKAPAVRASSTFSVSDNADLLPHAAHHHRDSTPKRMLPMPIPSAGGETSAPGED